MSESRIDSMDMLIWGGALLFVAILFIPNFFVDNFYLWLWKGYKGAELTVTSSWLGFLFPEGMENKLAFLRDKLARTEAVDLNWGIAVSIERYTLRYNWIWFLPVIYLIYKSFKYTPENEGILDFDGLIEKLTRTTFRFNRHLVKHNPQKDPRLDSSRGRYAQRIKTLDFAKKKQIITLNEGITMGDDKKYDFHADTAEEVLLSTLGNRYTGFDGLKRSEKWMLGAFLIWLSGDKSGYHEFLGDVSYGIAQETEEDAEKYFSIADEKASSIYEKCASPHPATHIIQNYMGKNSLGDDTANVVTDTINALAHEFNFDLVALSKVSKIYSKEWNNIVKREPSGVPFDSAMSVDIGYLAILYGALCIIDDEEDAFDAAINNIAAFMQDPNDLAIAEAYEQTRTDIEVRIISRYDHDPGMCLQEAVDKHYYAHGVILRLYDMCADMGVVCASRFTWLQLINRPLFFLLLDHGMPEMSAEVQASKAHYLVERECDRKLKTPEIKHQIDALRKRILERVDLADEIEQ